MTYAKTAPPRKSGWSPERRARHAARIRLWAPWKQSTGPKTRQGKAKSAQNAYKHGGRAAPMRLITKAFAAHHRFLGALNRHITMKKRHYANELLNPIPVIPSVVEGSGLNAQNPSAMLRFARTDEGENPLSANELLESYEQTLGWQGIKATALLVSALEAAGMDRQEIAWHASGDIYAMKKGPIRRTL